jgi:peptidoglycan/xylan/chitin deacetylase (PgdA/CDA1 family)
MRPGTLVISLDFELRWGVRDHCPPGDAYERNLIGSRTVIPRILKLFEDYSVAATWATVGLLFARNREEVDRFTPIVKPRYTEKRLDPYHEVPGEDETSDPLHYGASLIALIQASPRQEIGTHTFSHFFCNEPGATPESFAADLRAARDIALTWGIEPRSIVFPRNQVNPLFERSLLEQGIVAYRGNPDLWMWRFDDRKESANKLKRAARMADAYVNIGDHGTFDWNEIREPNGLVNVRASHFVRPYNPRLRALEPLRSARMRGAVRDAAQRGRLVHFWWHPHNFGRYQDECLAFFQGILDEFATCRERYGMQSGSMGAVADQVLSSHGSAVSGPDLTAAVRS